MSTIKVSKVEPVTSGGDCIVKATNIVGNKNLMINGAMQVAQRGTSSTSSGIRTLDRFSFNYGGHDESPTQAQHALTSSDTGPWEKGFRYSYHITNGNQTGGAATSDHCFFGYYIEAQDLANSGWDYTDPSSYITLSYWVKTSIAGTYYGYIETLDGTSQLFSLSTGALSANTWTKVINKIPGNANITIDNNNGPGFHMPFLWPYNGTQRTDSGHTLGAWAAYSGTSRTPDYAASTWWTTNDSTMEITGVQLEVGDIATGFENRTYADELRRSQRYYYKWVAGVSGYKFAARYNATGSGQDIPGMYWFPTTMRANPTGAFVGTWAQSNCSGISISGTSTDGCYIRAETSGSGSTTYYPDGASNGFTMTAELS